MQKESDLRHGGIKQHWLLAKIRRALRPKHHKIGKAYVPFDWAAGYEVNLEIGDQGQSDSCGGQAGSKWAEIRMKQGRISAKAVYSQGYAQGGGMAKASLENVMCNRPLALESQVPSYDPAGNPLSESAYEDKSWMGKAVAMPPLGLIPVTVGIDKESIAQAIRDTGSVIMLVEGQDGNDPGWLSSAPVPPRKSNPGAIWSHYMAASGANASYPKPVRFDQSWGAAVGDQGRQYFGDDYLSSGYITDVFTFMPKESMTQQKIGIIQRLLVLYQQLLSIAKSDARTPGIPGDYQ